MKILLIEDEKLLSDSLKVLLKSKGFEAVAGEGDPLSPEECKNIFKRFYRGDQARSMNQSYGLGLAIARQIVEEHGGKIWASGRDGWNTFFVSLPMANRTS